MKYLFCVMSQGLTARSEGELAISCLGAVTWCLIRCKLAKNILSLKRIESYNPHDSRTSLPIGYLSNYAKPFIIFHYSFKITTLYVSERR